MSTTKNGRIVIAGDDFSWIEENEKDLNQPEVLDANVRIALRLRKCMKERGWSQKDLAFALGVLFAKRCLLLDFVLFTFPFNTLGQSLYHKAGYREVGVFQNQGVLEGEFVDVMAMEKLL